MKRVAIYAHYDGRGVVRRYVEYQLRRLREACDEVVFVSTAELPEAELAKVRPYCVRATLRENVGYDFAMWKHELLQMPLDDVDELVLTNSSVFGPLFPLQDAFAKMAPVACDFWGMTESPTPLWHLQSYFLVFRGMALRHPCFRQFWESLYPYRTKRQLIYSYELGLSTFLVEHGLRAAAYAPYEQIAQVAPRYPWSRRREPPELNPSIFFPFALIERGMPFVKVEIFRDNVSKVPLSSLRRAIKATGYDVSLLEYDPR